MGAINLSMDFNSVIDSLVAEKGLCIYKIIELIDEQKNEVSSIEKIADSVSKKVPV